MVILPASKTCLVKNLQLLTKVTKVVLLVPWQTSTEEDSQ